MASRFTKFFFNKSVDGRALGKKGQVAAPKKPNRSGIKETVGAGGTDDDNDASLEFSKKDIPQELELAFYRGLYPDLQALDDKALVLHWLEQGSKEARFSNPQQALDKMLEHESIPSDFDAEEYLFLNPDLRTTMKWHHQAADHYAQFGLAENRRYKTDAKDAENEQHRLTASRITFDLAFYRDIYPDLSSLTESQVTEHWTLQGQIDGRFGNADHALKTSMQSEGVPENFSVDEYIRLNPDLASQFKYPYEAVHHYLDFGVQENRRYQLGAEEKKLQASIAAASAIELDYDFYRAQHADLTELDDESLLEHWQTQGYVEGRLGNPAQALFVALQNNDIPTDFDAELYISENDDLSDSFEWKFQAVEHFIQNGANEGRVYSSSTREQKIAHEAALALEAQQALDAQLALEAQKIQDEQDAKDAHQQEQDAKIEKAFATQIENAEFDADYYRIFNPDLSGLSDEKCKQHWVEAGVFEGRAPNIRQHLDNLSDEFELEERFNLPTYLRKNSDLIGHFSHKWQYFHHFLYSGRLERRSYIPDNADPEFIEGYYGLDDISENPELALLAIREAHGFDKFDAVYLNEHELIHYHGFVNAAFLDLFDHEAYIYSNNEITEQLEGSSRGECLEHFTTVGFKHCFNISYEHIFDANFYGLEYQTSLLHLVRDEDCELDSVWSLPRVVNRTYEHWIKFGIFEGKFANLSEMLFENNGLRLPTQVLTDISHYQVIHSDLATDSRPSRVYMSFLSHGVEEGRFRVTHSVETCLFYCKIARFFKQSNKPEVAIRLYEEVLANVPNYPLAMHELGDELINCKFYGKARECYQWLVDNGSATEWVYLNLAECCKHLSDFNAATRVLKKACETYPADTYLTNCAKDLVDDQFTRALSRSKTLVKMDRVEEGRQEVADALANFSVQCVDERIFRDAKRIAIVGNHDLPQCRFYRIDQKVELLENSGHDVDVFKHTESLTRFYAQLDQYDAVIFYRVPSIPNVIRAINATNVEGIPSIYDVDDLVFDSDHFPPPLSTYAGQISKEIHGNLTVDMPLMEHAISMCEYGMASTNSLATHMARYVRSGQVSVLRNGLSSVHLRSVAEHEQQQERSVDSDGPITIFYGSGTKAHKNDFHDIVEPVFTQLHQQYGEQVRFLVMGHITMTDSLKSLGSSLELLEPVSDIDSYWDILKSEADINLAVLSSTDVTDTKSEIKWIEAAMFGIPSVVSTTANYIDVVEHGVTGFVCEDSAQFLESLESLIQDKALRATVGSSAKDAVLNTYSVKNQAKQLVSCLDTYKKNAGASKTKIAIVNVFYPPEAIGGATRVVHDNVLELKALYGEDLDIQVFCTSAGSEGYATRQYERDGVKVTAVACPAGDQIDHNLTDKDMGIAFSRFLKTFNPDLVHFHCIQRLTESIVTETRRLGVPYVITAHDGWWVSDKQFLIDNRDKVTVYEYEKNVVEATKIESKRQKALHKELLGAENILAVSEPFRKIYESAGLENVITIENGVSGLTQVRKIKSASGKVRLAHIGGGERHKGLHLLKNVLMSSPEIENIELLVIDHAAPYGSFRKEMWGSTEVVFKAKTPQSKVAELYSEIDILVAPSVWPESYGLVTREALFCGCWVIASDRGAIGSQVSHGENGFVVSVDNLDDLRTAITTINNDHTRYLKPPEFDLKLRPSTAQAKELYQLYKSITQAAENANGAGSTIQTQSVGGESKS